MKQVRSVPKKYLNARLVAWSTQAAGYLVAATGPVLVYLAIQGASVAGKKLDAATLGVAFFLLVLTPLVGMPIVAQGQMMKIAIEVEHNTRAMVKTMRELSTMIRREGAPLPPSRSGKTRL